MSHFYGSMEGNRGTVTRCGTKNSGVRAHIRGWDSGVSAWMAAERESDGESTDYCLIQITSGSNGRTKGASPLIVTAHQFDAILAGHAELRVVDIEKKPSVAAKRKFVSREELAEEFPEVDESRKLTWQDHVDKIKPRGS